MFYYKQTMSSIGSPQASTCANDAVLREGHQSINSHLARRLWNLSFYAKKKRPKVMEHQLLLTFISSKSTRSSGEVIIRPKIFHNNFLRKKKKNPTSTNSRAPVKSSGAETCARPWGRTGIIWGWNWDSQPDSRNKALWSGLMRTHWGNP